MRKATASLHRNQCLEFRLKLGLILPAPGFKPAVSGSQMDLEAVLADLERIPERRVDPEAKSSRISMLQEHWDVHKPLAQQNNTIISGTRLGPPPCSLHSPNMRYLACIRPALRPAPPIFRPHSSCPHSNTPAPLILSALRAVAPSLQRQNPQSLHTRRQGCLLLALPGRAWFRPEVLCLSLL